MPDTSTLNEMSSPAPRNERRLWGVSHFWWVVISFWVLVSFASGVEVVLLHAGDGSQALGDIFTRLGPWLFMTVLIMRISASWTLDYENWRRSLVIYLVACAASMGVVALFAYSGPLPYFLARQITSITAGHYVSPHDMTYFVLTRVTTQLPVYWGLVAVAHAFRFYEREHQRRLREIELRTQLAEARLQALQLQLNPHFLFNTLNSISALVNENPANADKMIVALGDLLRETLATSDRKLVTIREELHLLDQYLLIEHIRFGGRLQIEMQVNEVMLDDQVPVFLLQPLVENAVKHGVENQLGKVTIQILVQPAGAGDFLLLEISNDCPDHAFPHQTVKERVGLTNTRGRLQTMFGSQATLKLTPREGGRFVVRIMIPRQAAPVTPQKPEPQPAI